MLWLGRGLGIAALGGVAGRVLGARRTSGPAAQPPHRYGWQIRPDLCSKCGRCETACVRRPSAVKACNDQRSCYNCVVCYGHLLDRRTPADRIAREGRRVCPYDAVRRVPFGDGSSHAFVYTIDPDRCVACGRCALECGALGNSSMFLAIRPDLCLGCNECAIARVCPDRAIVRVPLGPADEAQDPPPAGAQTARRRGASHPGGRA